MRARALVLSLVLAAAVAGPAEAQLTASRVRGAGPIADPDAAFWGPLRTVKVAMLPQTIALPHRSEPAVRELSVKAVHNGTWIAFRIEWADPTLSDRIVLDNFGDQVAVQLPVAGGDVPPAPMMGHAGARVNIMQWRAAFQHDLDAGPPTVRGLYPYAWADVYPDEILSASDARPYQGALGIENPISRGRASPVLDQMAEGWGTMTVKPDQHAFGRGLWRQGRWRVVITRPMAADDPNAPVLTPGGRTVVGFAVWEGGSREVGARKAWAPWLPLGIAR